MNIIDLRNKEVPVNHYSKFDRLPAATIDYLKEIIPENVPNNSTDLVKAINNLVWKKGIPIYLVNEYQMPTKYKEDDKATEFLGYYDYIDLGESICESIFLCMEKIRDDKLLLAKVLIHELGHALLEAGKGDYGYNFKTDDFIKFMEESLANYIVLKYCKDLGNDNLLEYCRTFISNQGFGYNFGIKWFDWDNRNYLNWIEIKKLYLKEDSNRTLTKILEFSKDYNLVCCCNSSTKCSGKNVEFKNELLKIFPIEMGNFCQTNKEYFERMDKSTINCGIINL